MKGRRHTPEQVVRKLREADRLLGEGFELPDVLKELEVSEATYHRWRAQYGGMKADDVKRLKELEAENAKLKRIVADQLLDIEGLKELSRGNFEPGASTSGGARVAGPARDVGASGVPAGRSASLHPAPRAGRGQGRCSSPGAAAADLAGAAAVGVPAGAPVAAR